MEIEVFLDPGTLFHKEITLLCLITKPSACEAFVLFHFDLTHKCGEKNNLEIFFFYVKDESHIK